MMLLHGTMVEILFEFILVLIGVVIQRHLFIITPTPYVAYLWETLNYLHITVTKFNITHLLFVCKMEHRQNI